MINKQIQFFGMILIMIIIIGISAYFLYNNKVKHSNRKIKLYERKLRRNYDDLI